VRCALKKTGSIDDIVCVICEKQCAKYHQYYKKNASDILALINEYVEKYPEKYEMEVTMVKDKKASCFAIVDTTAIEGYVTEDEIKKMDPSTMHGKSLIGSNEYMVVAKLVRKPMGKDNIKSKAPKKNVLRNKS